MKVGEVGEFGLIDLLARKVAGAPGQSSRPDRLIIGIGDDTAAWRCDSAIELATVDSLVQDIHFSLETATWRELGWKSLAINLSDIAAMGGVPGYALVALNLPEDTEVEDVTALYEGMLDLAGRTGTAIAGGNISGSPVVSITVTVIGSGRGDKLLRRSTARPGDVIAVTGHLGTAAAGLEMLTKKLAFGPEATGYLRDAFLHPVPRLDEGRVLIENGIATAIDISDGLIADLRHICEASRVGARVHADKLPVHQTVKDSFGEKALELALGGGEDYELLFTGAADTVARAGAAMACPVTVIGEITGGKTGHIDLVNAAGRAVKADRTGWRHF
ncbi:MAG TPA: thiamine-phosphate kinase [Dehalococcoidales bacterium]|nr:thiamine-phosphate kinase [Dehalococcoidales bacterium]